MQMKAEAVSARPTAKCFCLMSRWMAKKTGRINNPLIAPPLISLKYLNVPHSPPGGIQEPGLYLHM